HRELRRAMRTRHLEDTTEASKRSFRRKQSKLGLVGELSSIWIVEFDGVLVDDRELELLGYGSFAPSCLVGSAWGQHDLVSLRLPDVDGHAVEVDARVLDQTEANVDPTIAGLFEQNPFTGVLVHGSRITVRLFGDISAALLLTLGLFFDPDVGLFEVENESRAFSHERVER